MKSVLEFSHTMLSDILKKGDYVIDGTVGNGHDTKFLAQIVGANGRVYGFDIQELAIENTLKLLKDNNLDEYVSLFHSGHENIGSIIPLDVEIAGAIFNLGYLPKGDKSIITLPDTTITALDAVLERLQKGGRLIIVIYYGHPGGQDEKDAVETFASKLDQKSFDVLQYKYINQKNNPPYVIAIEKK